MQLWWALLIFNSIFQYSIENLDPLANFLKGSELELVTRARDVVANSIMAEIAKEDPQGDIEYQDAVRHQIVTVFQRLRLLLLVIDTLMEAYNATN